MPRRPTLLVLLFGLVLLAPDVVPAQEADSSIIAAAVRQRGFTCNDPQPPRRDFEYSTPDEPAWIIDCANGTYRVKFMGDTGASVEPVIGG
ncbi:MAG: hypothetical protein AAF495_10260 [Pseudomonadota bacterium]